MSTDKINIDLENLKSELIDLIGQSDEEEVFIKLDEFAKLYENSSLIESLAFIKSEYKDLQDDIERGTISFEDKNIARSKIREKLLEIVNKLDEMSKSDGTLGGEVVPEKVSPESVSTSKLDKFLSLVFQYGYIIIFIVSVYIFVHFSIKMLTDDTYVNSFIADFKYIPYLISLTGIAAACFLRTLSITSKKIVENSI